MENVVDVANYIFERYKQLAGEPIDEMKLHKILYLVQRETYAILNEPMFSEKFEGWKYGPVCTLVRSLYSKDGIVADCKPLSDTSIYIVNNIISQYAAIEAWQLSKLTHKEISWKNARIGLSPEQHGHVILTEEDIIADASKVRPYDSVWDMYYDEFEDADEDGGLD